MKKLYRLPEGFKFGSSASAWQTEGWTGKKEHQRNFVDMMYLAEPEDGLMELEQSSLQTFIIVMKKILN